MIRRGEDPRNFIQIASNDSYCLEDQHGWMPIVWLPYRQISGWVTRPSWPFKRHKLDALGCAATKGFSIWYCRISSYLRTETPVPRMTADPDIFGLSDQSTGCQRDDWKNHKEMCRRIDNHTGLLDDRERDANRWIFATTVHSPESCLLGDLLL